jgi:molecular chaperone GrpE
MPPPASGPPTGPPPSAPPAPPAGPPPAAPADPRPPTLAFGWPAADGERFDAVAAAAELEAALHAPPGEGEAAPPAGAPGPGYLELLESEVHELHQLLARREAEVAAADGRAERAQAEIEQSKQRLARESQQEVERRLRAVLLAFLEPLDDLDRALTAARGAECAAEVVAGVELVVRRYRALLERFDVRHLPALGQPFDPAQHEAVSALAAAPADRGRVVAVVREGYRIGDQLLRAAAVVVGRAP